MKSGTLYVVSTPIGNPDDLTLRALRILGTVDLIASEQPRATQALLAPHRIATPLTSYHNDNKEDKTPILLARLREGQAVALVCDAGTPTLQDPGCYLIAQAVQAGFTVAPIPGPSAVLAALVTSGWSGDAFVFAGAWPTRRTAQRRLLAWAMNGPAPIVLFIDPARAVTALATLAASLGNRSAVMGVDLTTAREQVLRGRLSQLMARIGKAPLTGEMTLVIQGRRGRGRRKRR